MFNFGQEHPNAAPTNLDNVGTLSTLSSDTAGVGSALATVAHDSGGGVLNNAVGGAAGIMLGASEMAQGNWAAGLGDAGQGLLTGASAIAPNVPGLGVAAGLAGVAGHGAAAWQHRDEIDGGYQNNQFWNEAGYTTLAGLNAAAALDPTGISSLYVGAGSLALDGLGALSGAVLGDDYRFNAGSAVGAAEHLVFDTGQAIGQGAMAAGGAIADGASSAWHGAENLASGAGNAISNGWHSLFGG